MLRPDSMNESELEEVASQLTDWLNLEMTQKMSEAAGLSESLSGFDAVTSPSPAFTLEETFEVYMLGTNLIDRAIESGKDLIDFAKPTHRSHHQVKINNAPVGFARSLIDDERQVSQLFISDLAKAYDRSIKWLETFEAEHEDLTTEDRLVRVLIVPAYHVHAFWLFSQELRKSELLVIEAPAELKRLETNRLLSSREFFEAFKDVLPTAGLIL